MNGSGSVEILGIRFSRLRPHEALGEAERLYEREAPGLVAHANAHTLNLAVADPDYKDVLNRADLVLNDGKGMMLAARLQRKPFPADLNGNFFTPLLLQLAARRGWPVFFLGAAPGVAERAARELQRKMPRLQVAGTSDGFFAPDEEAGLLCRIRESGAELLLVALGNPEQERWLHRNIAATGVRLGVGVGAFFDFTAGEMRRAPRWVNRLGLEWAYRLAREPRRLWRRYLVGNPLFVARVVRASLGNREERELDGQEQRRLRFHHRHPQPPPRAPQGRGEPRGPDRPARGAVHRRFK